MKYNEVEKFEVFSEDKDNNSELNSGIYNSLQYNVTFWVSSYQDADNTRVQFKVSVDPDPRISEVIDNFQMTVTDRDNKESIIDLGEVEPEELYWAGVALKKIAKHYGCTRESLEEKWNKEHK